MAPKAIKTIGILGTGTIGSSWATFYAGKGFQLKMYDVDKSTQKTGFIKARENLGALARYGLLEDSKIDAALSNISSSDTFEEFCEGLDYVQESVAENYEVKNRVFRDLDSHTAPDTILASSSSGLLMSEIQKNASRPNRCLIAHPFNPPHLIPLVELVPGRQTDPELIEEVRLFFEKLGKTPVVLKKEAPGHIANRLAAALWREAIDIVMRGISTVEDVDKALHAGPGIRWALMGQHLIYHLGGGEGGYGYFIDHIGKAFGTLWEDMANWTEIPEESKKVLVEGVTASIGNRDLKEIAQWRDGKIVDLLKIKQGPISRENN
jgi:carnitine 3-dehydrogenase